MLVFFKRRQHIIQAALKKYQHYQLYESWFQESLGSIIEAIQPHLILIDLTEDYQNKLRFINRLRNDENLNKLPILALIEEDESDLKNIGFEYGINEFFVNDRDNLPLLEAYVYKILHHIQLINARRVLVIDDSITLLQGIRFTLKNQGFLVEIAQDFFSALQILAKELPDVIILDITMPVMNGFQVARFLKSEPHLRTIPIIAISGINISKSEAFYARSLGIEKYILKPFNQNKIINSILGVKIAKQSQALQPEYTQDYILTRLNQMLDVSNFKLIIGSSLNHLIKKQTLAPHQFWKNFVDLIARLLYISRVCIRIGPDLFVAYHPDSSFVLDTIKSDYKLENSSITPLTSTEMTPHLPTDPILFHKTLFAPYGQATEITIHGSEEQSSPSIDKQILELLDDFVSNTLPGILHFYYLRDEETLKIKVFQRALTQFKNPLNALQSFFETLHLDWEEIAQPSLYQQIQKSLNQIQYVYSEISSLFLMKTFFKPYKDKIRFDHLLQCVERVVKEEAEGKNIRIEYPEADMILPVISGDKELLNRLLELLIYAAINHGAENSVILIQLQKSLYWLELELSFHPELMNQVHPDSTEYLSWEGMIMIREIIRIHNGHLKIEPQENGRMMCCIHFPLYPNQAMNTHYF